MAESSTTCQHPTDSLSSTPTPSALLKLCKRCGEPKPIDAFYVCSSARDGRYSWCKPCSNKVRAEHREATRQDPERRALQASIAAGERPRDCPTCSTPTPPRQMRGYVIGDDMLWRCLRCRIKDVTQCQWCDWCCESFTSARTRQFCSRTCAWSWYRARAERTLDPALAALLEPLKPAPAWHAPLVAALLAHRRPVPGPVV